MYFFLMAAAVAFLVGIITNEILRKNFGILLKDAENMDHTGNDFLKKIRVKYENYIRTGHEIKNTEAFAEKYLDRFRIYGIKAHSFEKLSAVSAGMCVVFGVCGAMLYPKNKTEYLLVGFLAMYVIVGMRRLIDINGKRKSIAVNIVDFFENRYVAATTEKAVEKPAEEGEEKVCENTDEPVLSNPIKKADFTEEEREIITEILERFLE